MVQSDVLFQKMKGLMRKRSSTAARLQRALSAKSLRPESPPPTTRPVAPAEKRTFIMEAPVQFSSVSSIFRHVHHVNYHFTNFSSFPTLIFKEFLPLSMLSLQGCLHYLQCIMYIRWDCFMSESLFRMSSKTLVHNIK